MTHDTPPKRIWACPPDIFDGMGFWQDQPHPDGIEYTLTSDAKAMVADALAPVMDLLMESVASHTDSDWLKRRHDLLMQVSSALPPAPEGA